MGKKNGLKDLDIRIRLPWKDDPREAHRLYMQIVRSDDPEAMILKFKKDKTC
jgi:hypothetical protein